MIDLGIIQALAAGREELGLLLYSSSSPSWLARRVDDGRSDEQLKADWLTKVEAAGLAREGAIQFLEARLAC